MVAVPLSTQDSHASGVAGHTSPPVIFNSTEKGSSSRQIVAMMQTAEPLH